MDIEFGFSNFSMRFASAAIMAMISSIEEVKTINN